MDELARQVKRASKVGRGTNSERVATPSVARWGGGWLSRLFEDRLADCARSWFSDLQRCSSLPPWSRGSLGIPRGVMLDIKLLRDDPESIAKNLRDRSVRPFDDLPEGDDWPQVAVDRLSELDRRYLDLLREMEALRREQNENAAAMKKVGKLAKEAQAEARLPLLEQGRELRERSRQLDEKLDHAANTRDEAWGRVPNLTHPAVPRGHSDDDHVELRTWGKPRDFAAEGFAPLDHLQIGESLGLIDFEAGSRVAGQKFYFLQRDAVMLDLALQQFALQVAARHGFLLNTTPDLARADVVAALGFNPRGESTQIYSVAQSDLCLVGTAEITLGGLVADRIFEEAELPLYLAGLSHCFRTEAGSHGQESKGLYRVHQFTKVEMFAVTAGRLEDSNAAHERILAIEEEIFQALEIPYRVLDMASIDLAGQAYRKFDIEAWMPGRGNWGEVTSASNCTDYQARRLKVRWRPEESDGQKRKPKIAHMLNGTAVATSRALVAILENHQLADGSVRVPEVLRPWVGKEHIVAPTTAR